MVAMNARDYVQDAARILMKFMPRMREIDCVVGDDRIVTRPAAFNGFVSGAAHAPCVPSSSRQLFEKGGSHERRTGGRILGSVESEDRRVASSGLDVPPKWFERVGQTNHVVISTI